MHWEDDIVSNIELIDVTSDNWDEVCCLYPGKEGIHFVASNSYSIVQSKYEDGWLIKAVTANKKIVGFTMYGYSNELQAYELCRFMIDYHYQGNGYGKEALKVIIDEMQKHFHCSEIYLSTAPNNDKAKHIYGFAGFIPTGGTCGEGNEIEDIFCLKCKKDL